MSSRRPANNGTASANALRAELEALKKAHVTAEIAGKISADGAPVMAMNKNTVEETTSFSQLSSVEQAAGSLGVHPDAWKPIKFMNAAHYDTLLKNNAIGEDLARRIEVCFKHAHTQNADTHDNHCDLLVCSGVSACCGCLIPQKKRILPVCTRVCANHCINMEKCIGYNCKVVVNNVRSLFVK